MVQKSIGRVPGARGRPRSFDTDVVLSAVRNTFWRYGYGSTSMDQLAAATGLHKPSLYGAFGDKRRLYLAALQHYLAEVSADFAEALARDTWAESATDLLDQSIDMFLREKEGANGCFMMHTAMTETNADPEIMSVVHDAIVRLDKAVVRRFQRAIEQGEFPAGADAEALAMIIVAAHYEISARARAGFTRDDLEAIAARAIRVVQAFGGSLEERAKRAATG